MLRGECLGLLQLSLARARQAQRVAAAVGGGGQALGEPALFEPVQQAHQARAFDAEGAGEFRLRQALIGADHHQHGKLRRADFHARQRADEVLENPHLRPAHEIAEVLVEHVEVDHGGAHPARPRLCQRQARPAAVPLPLVLLTAFSAFPAFGWRIDVVWLAALRFRSRRWRARPLGGNNAVDAICCPGQQCRKAARRLGARMTGRRWRADVGAIFELVRTGGNPASSITTADFGQGGY